MKPTDPERYANAIHEISEQADYRLNGPKDWAKCPDCGATLSIRNLENERYELNLVKHEI